MSKDNVLLKVRKITTSFGVPIAFLFTILLFSYLRPESFLTIRNANAILTIAAPILVSALGCTIILSLGELDLSFAAVIGLASAITFLMLAEDKLNLPWGIAIIGGIFTGALAGVLNGLFVSYLGISSIITTLGMGTLLVGIEYFFTDQVTYYGAVPKTFLIIGQGRNFLINNQVWIAAFIAFLIYILLQHTELGRFFYAIGGNSEVARLSGIRVKYVRAIGFIIASSLAAISGIILTSQSASSSPAIGQPYLLPSLTSAFLGTSMFKQGQFNVPGTIVGVVFLGVIQTGLIMLHLSTAAINVTQGAILIIAVLFSRFGSRD